MRIRISMKMTVTMKIRMRVRISPNLILTTLAYLSVCSFVCSFAAICVLVNLNRNLFKDNLLRPASIRASELEVSQLSKLGKQ